jgi:GNAT superfamily N-acetyltransferase
MATYLNPAPAALDREQCLLESERAYFLAGAQNRPVCGGMLSLIPGLQHLPAGCVLHSVTTTPSPQSLADWLRTLERRFLRAGSKLSRFYLPAGTDELAEGLRALGYRASDETGYIRDFAGDCSGLTPHLNLRPLDPARDWAQKVQLCIQTGVGPDGYDMRHGAYATLERVKCEAGYMRSYLYWIGDRAVGAVSLAVHGRFARLKNLLVHPQFRGRGVGRALVVGTMAKARSEGAELFGVFGASTATRRLYLGCGLSPLTRQIEWSRLL